MKSKSRDKDAERMPIKFDWAEFYRRLEMRAGCEGWRQDRRNSIVALAQMGLSLKEIADVLAKSHSQCDHDLWAELCVAEEYYQSHP